MTAISKQEIAALPVEFKLNGKTVVGRADETIIQTAGHYGIEIPHLCYKEGLRPDGNCRACVVEIKGERTLAPSCCRMPSDGMDVTTDSARAIASQKMVLELLLSDMSGQSYSPDSELDQWVRKLQVGKPRFAPRAQPAMDVSHPAIAVNLDACIQCTRCLRACREEQVNDVIGYAFRGEHSKIVFDLDDPMGLSTCVACGECVQACPTGALMPARNAALEVADRTVDSVCPYCGVGCQLTYHVKDEKIMHVQGRDGPANHGRLCVKGRYGFDYVQHPQRLTLPLMRRKGVPKTADFVVDPDNWRDAFRGRPGKGARFRGQGLRDIRIRTASTRSPVSGRQGSNEEAPCSRNWYFSASAQQRRPLHAAMPCLIGIALLEGVVPAQCPAR
jgi:formate dehydrogenase major subunit